MIDILAFGAHPDDIEFGCGGMLALAAQRNQSIVLVDLTEGKKGTHDGSILTRKEESQKAAALIHATRYCLEFPDCAVYNHSIYRKAVLEIIEQHQPRCVLAPYWKGTQTHPDHLACGQLVRAAVKELGRGQIRYYLFPNFFHADILIDTTDAIPLWIEMMSCHQSQMLTNPYVDWNIKIAKRWGVVNKTPYAQPLLVETPILTTEKRTE